jgi:signal transduction histidine kinase/HPt (histidine-containing phosphotransfer) domain-containing protein
MSVGAQPGERGRPAFDILIVEDSPTQAAMLRYLLEEEGYAVASASNGVEALAQSRSRKPALVISDVVMPEMDGFTLCREIKASPDLEAIPVILVTTLADPRDVIRGLECGADFFLRKPYDEQYLLSRVEYALSTREERRREDSRGGLRVTVDGEAHLITSERRQILDMLISTYEQAVHLNRDLELREHALQEEKERADAANRAKSTFLAMMSHEIRTPLSGVLGLLELLSLTRLDADQRATVDVVLESAQSLQHIIDDILDFSKIEAEKMELRPEVGSLTELVAAVHKLYSGAASSKGVTLEYSVDPRISPALVFDAVRLRQILNNLVSNALKFTARGSVSLDAELLERGDTAEEVRFVVADTGIGIAREDQDRLFQPFVQADADVSRAGSGTGLGLTITKRLVEMMGGRIALRSEPGRGTAVQITLNLPRADPTELPAAAERASVQSIAARRHAPGTAKAEQERTLVLIVDDHPTNRMLLQRQLAMLGYASEASENGAEALQKWKSGRFAAIITDMNMPKMDGYELTRTIREIESQTGRTRTIVLACTAIAPSDVAEGSTAAGLDDYLSKPVGLAELMAKLDRWLPLPAVSSRSARVERSAAAKNDEIVHDAVDRSALAAMCGGDAAAECEILTDFRRVNDGDVLKLHEAIVRRDIEQVTRVSHAMKGASRTIGARDLANVCERLERAARAADWESVEANIDALDHEVARVNAFIDAVSGTLTPSGS